MGRSPSVSLPVRSLMLSLAILNLPGDLSGIDILNALKSLPHQVDGILITAIGSDDVKSRAKSLGAAYMEKPIQLGELEKTIEQRARQ
jgi:DNA-binding response OmpR family regulator